MMNRAEYGIRRGLASLCATWILRKEIKFNILSSLISNFHPHHLAGRIIDEGLSGALQDILAHSNLKNPAVESLRTVINSFLIQRAAREIKARNQLRLIFEEAGRKSIDVLLMRGVAISRYYSTPESREYSDVDLIIGKNDKQEFIELLQSLGFKSRRETLESYVKSDVSLDLHTDPIGADIVPERRNTADIEFDQLLDNSIFVKIQPESTHAKFKPFELRVPDTTDEFILSAVHWVKHSFDRLCWGIDLVVMAEKIQKNGDWHLIDMKATSYGVHRLVQNAVSPLNGLFGYIVPRLQLPAGIRDTRNALTDLICNRISQGKRIPLTGHLFYMLNMEGLSAKIKYFFNTIFPARPTRDSLRSRYNHDKLVRFFSLFRLKKLVQYSFRFCKALAS